MTQGPFPDREPVWCSSNQVANPWNVFPSAKLEVERRVERSEVREWPRKKSRRETWEHLVLPLVPVSCHFHREISMCSRHLKLGRGFGSGIKEMQCTEPCNITFSWKRGVPLEIRAHWLCCRRTLVFNSLRIWGIVEGEDRGQLNLCKIHG